MMPAAKTPPPDRRPYQPASAATSDRVVYTTPPSGQVVREVLRQIGWHGFSGAFYSLGEEPMRHEPSGFAPVWLTVDSQPIAPPDDAEEAERRG